MSELPNFSEHGYTLVKVLTVNPQGGRIAYAGEDRNGRRVFVKRFTFAGFDASWAGFEEQRREVQMLRELDHPRIPNYLDCFTTDDGVCLVQEWLELPSLDQRTSFDAAELRTVALSLLDILVYLQERLPPVIHRDIKPANVLLDAQGQAYLVDFGLARAGAGTASTIAVGTPGFMSPEQMLGRKLTPASDLFGLGATLIAMLTGTPAHELGELINASMRFDLSGLPAGLDPAFVRWLERMVAPDLAQRFADARTARGALEQLGVRSVAPPASKPLRSKPAASLAPPRAAAARPAAAASGASNARNGLPVTVLLSVLAIVGVGVFLFDVLPEKKPKPPEFERRFPDPVNEPEVVVAPKPEPPKPPPEPIACDSKMTLSESPPELSDGPAVIAHMGCELTLEGVSIIAPDGIFVGPDAHVTAIDTTIVASRVGLEVHGNVTLVRSKVFAPVAARVIGGLVSLDDASTLDGETDVDVEGWISGLDHEADVVHLRETRLSRYEKSACIGVKRCYNDFRGSSQVDVRADIDTDGTVRRVRFEGKRPAKAIATCIVEAQMAAPIHDYEPLDGPGVRICRLSVTRGGFGTTWGTDRSFELKN